jgi:uncharacterized protein (DUF362 family)
MRPAFLHIARIPSGNQNRLSELVDFYNSEALPAALNALVKSGIHPDEIRNKKVLFKPNWVRHSIAPDDELCMRTHDNFVVAALKIILEMGPSSVVIGDAPIQGCEWDKMISGSFSDKILKLSEEFGIPVQIKDFRRKTYNVADNTLQSEIRPISDYLIFDTGKDSALEPITAKGFRKFRVTNYDPDRMTSAHAPGIHKYCIAKEFFEADVVILLPKIKTHQKTGLTGALKNLVGINGDKDFLPHHRMGGTTMGGDCYPGGSVLRYWSELSLDKANRRQGKSSFWFWQKFSSLLWKLSFPGPEHQLAAGWHGNDTTWRMVMDLNKVGIYGDIKGKLSKQPQRQIYSLCDGIIAGQSNGPLEPEPLPLGILSFTNHSLSNDRAMALLMGLPIGKISLLDNSFTQEADCEVTLDGKRISMEELKVYSIQALPPKGWIDYFNNAGKTR